MRRAANPTILCLENSRSHFAASRVVFESGSYELVAATTAASALAALKAIPRISVAVLSCGDVAPEVQRQLADAMERAKPGVRTLIVAPLGIFPHEKSAPTYVEWVDQLNFDIERMLTSRPGDLKQTNLII